MKHRGILTEDDRDYYRENPDPEERGRRGSDIRYRARQRIANLVKDLELLEEVGEGELVSDFHAKTDRTSRTQEEIDELRERLDELENEG